MAPADICFGVARMYEMHCNFKPEYFQIFRTLDEALSWLEVEPVREPNNGGVEVDQP